MGFWLAALGNSKLHNGEPEKVLYGVRCYEKSSPLSQYSICTLMLHRLQGGEKDFLNKWSCNKHTMAIQTSRFLCQALKVALEPLFRSWKMFVRSLILSNCINQKHNCSTSSHTTIVEHTKASSARSGRFFLGNTKIAVCFCCLGAQRWAFCSKRILYNHGKKRKWNESAIGSDGILNAANIHKQWHENINNSKINRGK